LVACRTHGRGEQGVIGEMLETTVKRHAPV
jgi:hypothetical protein